MASGDVDRLRDNQWERLRDLVPGGRAGQRGPHFDNRLFVDALLWMARSGAHWCDLPERFGDDQAVKRRLLPLDRAWCPGQLPGGAHGRGRPRVADDRQHHRARAPACRRCAHSKGEPDAQRLCRSRGGLSTKLHAATDALGNPVRLLFGPGQRHDATRSHELIAGLEPKIVIADKGYDADPLHQAVRGAGAEPVIPTRANRKERRPHDKALYKERSLIERIFNKLKQFRRVATRYDKLLADYEGFVQPAAISILLR